MSKEIWELDAVAAANNFLPVDGGWVEGMDRSDVNDASRENLATARRDYDDRTWQVVRVQGPLAGDIGVFAVEAGNLAFSITLAGVDLTGQFNDGRIVLVEDGVSPGVDLVTQVEGTPVFSGGNKTTVTIKAVDAPIAAGASDAKVYISSIARGLALENQESDFYIPVTDDDVGVKNAMDAAVAAGGGAVLLINDAIFEAPVTIPTGDLRVIGAMPNTQVKAKDASDMSTLFLKSTSGDISFDNIRFNANHFAQASGTNRCIELTGALAPSFTNCVFEDCRDGIFLKGVDSLDVHVAKCDFRVIRRHGIASEDVTDAPTGSITDCNFSGEFMDETNPAGIKVSGKWSIKGCQMIDMGHASELPRGIWLWNKTGIENGAYQSRVSGCSVDASNAANGIGIEVGASKCVAANNVTKMGTAGTGIYVISRTGAQIISGVVVDGNVCEDGAAGIKLNDLIDDSLVADNTIESLGGAIGIDSEGGDNSIQGNKIYGVGLAGIKLRSLSSNETLRDNTITTSGNAFVVDLGATSPIIRDNTVISGGNVSNAEPTMSRWGNNFDTHLKGVDVIGWDPVVVTEVDVIGATALDMPCGGSFGKYLFKVSFYAYHVAGGRGVPTFRLYGGVNGTKADTLLATFGPAVTLTDNALVDFVNETYNFEYSVTILGITKWGLSVQHAGARYHAMQVMASSQKMGIS